MGFRFHQQFGIDAVIVLGHHQREPLDSGLRGPAPILFCITDEYRKRLTTLAIRQAADQPAFGLIIPGISQRAEDLFVRSLILDAAECSQCVRIRC